MPFFLAGFVLLGLAMVIWGLVTIEPARLARAMRAGAIGALALVGLVLAIRGLAVLDVPLGGLMLYLLHHWSARGFPGVARLKERLRNWVTGRAQQQAGATIETDLLRMTLDQATGTLSGEVLSGQFLGARLDQLTLIQLQALHAECAGYDTQSQRLLETYLDRTHPEWRETASQTKGDPPGGLSSASRPMTREEALQVLGLERAASRTEIRDAHHRLMKKLHPDHGGTDYLASQINTARDVLLKEG